MSTAAHPSAKSTISYAPVRRTGAPAHGRSQRNPVPSPLQPHTTSTGVTDRAFADQFDARGRKTSFINESTFPLMTPSLASMRWIVGSERPERWASSR